MRDATEWSSSRESDIHRLERFFADVFGADVLYDLPLRLDTLRRRPTPGVPEWPAFTSFRPAPRS